MRTSIRNTLIALCVCFTLSLGSLFTPQDAQAQTDYPDLLVITRGGSGNDAVLRYDWLTMASLGSFVPAGSGGLSLAHRMVFGPDENLYVASYGTSEVLRYERQTGVFLGAFVTSGSGGLTSPRSLAFGPDGNLYVSSETCCWPSTWSILKYDGQSGAFLGVFVPNGSGGLSYTDSLLFGPDGNLYAFTTNTPRIVRYDGQTGAFLGVFVGSFPCESCFPSQPFSMVFGLDGKLLVLVERSAFPNNEGAVLRYDGQTGAFLDVFVPFGSGGLHYPSNLTMGPDRNIYVSSHQETIPESPRKGAVRRYDGQTGDFLSLAVPPGFGGLGDAGTIVFMPVGAFGCVQLANQPLAGVAVDLKQPGKDGRRTTTTDLNGCYSFRSTTPSKGTITIALPER